MSIQLYFDFLKTDISNFNDIAIYDESKKTNIFQPSFDFFTKTDISNLNNFIIHDGNRIAFEFITSGSIVDSNIYLLTGASGSGKTYICDIWQKVNDPDGKKRYIIEDLEKTLMTEEQLFHFINSALNENAILLITSTKNVDEFNFTLPDLQSRIRSAYNIFIEKINSEKTKKQILLKLLSDKQLNLSNTIINYIIKYSDNSYKTIIDFVNELNKMPVITMEKVGEMLEKSKV